jgi:hypothetical protein
MVLCLFVGGYLAVGVGVAAIAFRRRVSLVQVVLLVPLWPLLAPAVFSERAVMGGLVTDRERTVIERFREYVVVRGRQLEALRRLRSRGRASERLTQLEGQVERDLEDARRLLEELEDRIALAHVAALGPTAGDTVDRQHVEALLARADALVHETARDLGTDAPVAAS